jgi:hypothetical protein
MAITGTKVKNPGTKSRNKNFKNLGTKITKIRELKLQKSRNKNLGTKIQEQKI